MSSGLKKYEKSFKFGVFTDVVDIINRVLFENKDSSVVKLLFEQASELFILDECLLKYEQDIESINVEIINLSDVDELDLRAQLNSRWYEQNQQRLSDLKSRQMRLKENLTKQNIEYLKKESLLNAEINEFFHSHNVDGTLLFDAFYNSLCNIDHLGKLDFFGKQAVEYCKLPICDISSLAPDEKTERKGTVLFKIEKRLANNSGETAGKSWSYVKYRVTCGTSSIAMMIWDPETFMAGSFYNIKQGSVCCINKFFLYEYKYSNLDKKELQLKPASNCVFKILGTLPV